MKKGKEKNQNNTTVFYPKVKAYKIDNTKTAKSNQAGTEGGGKEKEKRSNAHTVVVAVAGFRRVHPTAASWSSEPNRLHLHHV